MLVLLFSTKVIYPIYKIKILKIHKLKLHPLCAASVSPQCVKSWSLRPSFSNINSNLDLIGFKF